MHFLVIAEFFVPVLTYLSLLHSGAGSVGSQVVDKPGLSEPAAPVLVAAPELSPLAPFGQIPVPALAGWPAAGLSLPSVTFPSIDTIGIPSECLLLKNVFDPKLEVGAGDIVLQSSFFLFLLLMYYFCSLNLSSTRILRMMLRMNVQNSES